MLNKGATTKIIKRLFTKPTMDTPDSLFECVCIIGDKAVFTDGYIAVITKPENLQVDSELYLDYKDIDNQNAKDGYNTILSLDMTSLEHFVLINRNSLTEKFKEAKNHKYFTENPYRFRERPILTQLGTGHMRYDTSLLIDAAKMFKGKNCYFAMTHDGNFAVVTDWERTAYAIIAPSFAYPFDEIDKIPCVKIEDIAVF